MRTLPATRNRIPSERVVSGLRQIMGGIFGTSRTVAEETKEQASAVMGFYNFHQGDLFLPGPPSFAMDPSHETPLTTVWGHAFLVRPNAFQPFAYGQIAYSAPIQPLVGLGGVVSGQLVSQPLTVRQVIVLP